MNVVVVGDMNTGKTSFVRNQCTEYVPTIGVDFVCYKSGGLRIWDTAGQERFNAIVASYYRLAEMVLIFYACNNAESMKSVERWIADVSLKTDVPLYVVGSKCDLGPKKGPADFFISNKTGEGLKELRDLFRASSEVVDLGVKPAQQSCCYT